jgi:Family of unknown function (DUF6256)
MSSHLIRSDLVPIVSGYVILMVILAVGLRTSRRRTAAGLPTTRLTGRLDRGWPALVVHAVLDAIGGYLVLMAVVVLYYYGVAKVGSNFLDSAFTGPLLLLAVALPVFAVLSLLTRWRHERHLRHAAGPGDGRPAGERQPGGGPPPARP